MLGAIIGDIVGSIYERNNTKNYNFELFTPCSHFTDDTVCNVALLKCFKFNGSKTKSTQVSADLKLYCRQYDYVGYGKMFRAWVASNSLAPYKSWGNGGAMRVLMISEFFAKQGYTLDSIHKKIKLATNVTHNSPAGVKGALCVADCIVFLIDGIDKISLKKYIETNYYYLDFNYEDLVANYGKKFDVSTQGSIPQAIFCFLDSTSFEDCLRKCITIGGDSDTIAAIGCTLAEHYYKTIPLKIIKETLKRTPDEFLNIIEL